MRKTKYTIRVPNILSLKYSWTIWNMAQIMSPITIQTKLFQKWHWQPGSESRFVKTIFNLHLQQHPSILSHAKNCGKCSEEFNLKDDFSHLSHQVSLVINWNIMPLKTHFLFTKLCYRSMSSLIFFTKNVTTFKELSSSGKR